MPKGKKAKYLIALTNLQELPCGKNYEGSNDQVYKLVAMHEKVCKTCREYTGDVLMEDTKSLDATSLIITSSRAFDKPGVGLDSKICRKMMELK